MKNFPLVVAAFLAVGTAATAVVWQNNATAASNSQLSIGTVAQTKRTFPPDNSTAKYVLADAQWRRVLTKQQYYVLRKEGTDAPFTGNYKKLGDGVYRCVGCNNILYSSATQFDSGTGWPSFWKPLRVASIRVLKDVDGQREEVECKRCGSHLGHVFSDGPKPTGLRYCMNQSALKFEAK